MRIAEEMDVALLTEAEGDAPAKKNLARIKQIRRKVDVLFDKIERRKWSEKEMAAKALEKELQVLSTYLAALRHNLSKIKRGSISADQMRDEYMNSDDVGD